MIIHFSTVHPRTDSRIRYKMVASLHERFPGEVSMFVQDGLGEETDAAGFRIVDTGPPLSRIKRMVLGGWRMFRAVLRARPKLAHFHDPELMPWAFLLRIWGIKVIYDVHEDYPLDIKQKSYLPSWVRTPLASCVGLVEWAAGHLLSGVVLAGPSTAHRFPKTKIALVRNFADLSEWSPGQYTPMSFRPKQVAYVGTISKSRNIFGMIDCLTKISQTDAILQLAGTFAEEREESQAKGQPGWDKVVYHGPIGRAEVASLLANARAGLMVLLPLPQFVVATPIKLFEYMASGLPVIASDFPLWRELVEKHACGVLVDPADVTALAHAITWLIEHPEEAEAMGRSGRLAVESLYNWQTEFKELVGLYDRLINS